MHKGYKETFLGKGLEVPQPIPSSGHQLIHKNAYSVLFNPETEQAWVSMANLDGSKWPEIGEAEDKIKRGSTWTSTDGVQNNSYQSLYSESNPWDRGHLTPWSHMCWGSDKDNAKARADDTNDYINSSAQHFHFNQYEWKFVETGIKEFTQKIKVTTYTGPVFTKYDRWFSPNDNSKPSVRIPSAFWKIIFWRNNNSTVKSKSLESLAFLCYQSRAYLVASEYGGAVKERRLNWLYLKSTENIGQITGLTFDEGLIQANYLKGSASYQFPNNESLATQVLDILKDQDKDTLKNSRSNLLDWSVF